MFVLGMSTGEEELEVVQQQQNTNMENIGLPAQDSVIQPQPPQPLAIPLPGHVPNFPPPGLLNFFVCCLVILYQV